MSAHVLLNLLNDTRKGDKMGDLSSILSPFLNVFKRFNNTGARMLDSIVYIMTLNYFEILFLRKTLEFASFHNFKASVGLCT